MSLSQISPNDFEQWCNEYLKTDNFKDYCPNGLQVDANSPIHRIVTGVTATQNLIEAAIAQKADAIVVHHGYFWRGEAEPLVGMKGRRVRTLFKNNISLLAYHLPLDAHPLIGNNAVLAQQLGLKITGALYPNEQYPVGNIAQCDAQPVEHLVNKITATLNRKPLHIKGMSNNVNNSVTTIGICTGGAQDMIDQAARMGCQVYISGEISERTTHLARELNIDYLACGHHATEIGGIRAFGDLIQQSLGLPVRFIDDSNPA